MVVETPGVAEKEFHIEGGTTGQRDLRLERMATHCTASASLMRSTMSCSIATSELLTALRHFGN